MQRPFLIALHRSIFLTFRRYSVLKARFKSDWKFVWEKASMVDLKQAGLDVPACEKLKEARQNVIPEQELERLEKNNISILFIEDGPYPACLETVDSPPVLLFLKGTIPSCGLQGLGVVGSRKITSYGKRVIRSFLPSLVSFDIPIVSGMALGVDIEAHKAAVEAGGFTIGVLANGIDHVCPTAHQTFADSMIRDEKGVLVSEYLPGISPRPEYFPVRNRIIAGLSKSILVVEATEKSGTLITARLGLEQGKDVFTVPGDIFAPQSKGCNRLLIRGEAAPVRHADDIISAMNLQGHQKQQELSLYVPENQQEASIIELLQQKQYSLDELLGTLPYDKVTLLATLTLLEMKGVVTHIGAQTYCFG